MEDRVMEPISGGALIARMLQAEGVEVVFGIIDGSYFGLYSSLRDVGIRLITPRHETSAVHMAGAYARLTGKLGVCIASNGPGAANALAGVAVENGEGNRVLLITSWRRGPIVNPDRGGTYQYFDQTAVIRPMSKWSEAAESFERIPELTRRALRQCHIGRPGVVHLCVPEDLVNGVHPYDSVDVLAPERYRRTTRSSAPELAVREAADLLLQSELPMIHAGSGVLHAQATAELRELADLLQAPVTTSWAARDVIDERAAVSIPMNLLDLNTQVRNDADVVLALGTRFGETDWWGKPPYWRNPTEQRLIQVDVDEDALGQNKPVDVAVVADIKAFSIALLAELKGRGAPANGAARLAKLQSYGAEREKGLAALGEMLEQETELVHSARVPKICRDVFDEDAILVTDGGNTNVWANMFHEVHAPHSMLSTYKFGMLGAGVGQTLAAKVACPERDAYCIIGDGAMAFHAQEIETAVRNDLPVIFLVLCDRQWGMVKVNQEITLDPQKTLTEGELPADETINTDLGETRFDLLAESMGAIGERVSRNEDLESAIRRCLDSGRVCVIHIDVDRVKHKFAPHLAEFKQMHLEPAGI
jgi:acetolactate synthase-1/2/3 large subunit